MSMINDALKRAKQAQQQTSAPPPDLPLRPVEPAQQHAWQNLGLFVPAALACVALLALFLLWRWAQTRELNATSELTARAAVPAVSIQPAPIPPPVAVPAATPALDSTSEAPAAIPAIAPETNLPAATPAAMPVATPVVAPAPPQPAPLRLQGILFNPQRPSAMINGKTLFLGDKLGDLRVVAIDQQTAVLVGPGQTNILTLSD